MKIGDWFMPECGPVSSGIKVISMDEKGVKVRRMHVSYNGEEFFLTHEAFAQSKWRELPEGTQLRFL